MSRLRFMILFKAKTIYLSIDMSQLKNKNGHGEMTYRPRIAEAALPPAHPGIKENLVIFRNQHGTEAQGRLLRIERFQIVFEFYRTDQVLQVSEILDEFKVFAGGREIYTGAAVVMNLLPAGIGLACEVKLNEPGITIGIRTPDNGQTNVLDAYHAFFKQWQVQSKLLPEFKLAVLDFKSYLWDLRLLLDQISIAISSHAMQKQPEVELQVAKDLKPAILSTVDALRERLLEATRRIKPEAREAHQIFLRRHLHPLTLSAPFAYRTYQKPLGYAGDYEMMNMIHRNTFEGRSLYSKIVHYWLVSQYPAISVRNRAVHMKEKLIQETSRIARKKRVARILNIGCGPAQEVQNFMAETPLADQADFTLLDFDAETLDYCKSKIREAQIKHGRKTRVRFQRMSVTSLIKNSALLARQTLGGDFDLIYCGGLFDYLTDPVCKKCVDLFYHCLAPGGLVVVANMSDRVPFRDMMEFLLDWHLIYRNADCMASFEPENIPPESARVITEPVGVNLFLEIRKPERG